MACECKSISECKGTCDMAQSFKSVAPIERALATQVGGGHYKNLAIQPAEFVHRNRIPYLEGSIIYYVTRWREKNGIEDLRKARHTLDMLIEMESVK